jgi:bifunctional DNase/RNase
MPELIECAIDRVVVSLMSPQRIVLLRQKDDDRFLPIWVGPYEAEAITIALQEVEMARPLTHDLLKNVFTTFNALLLRVEITSLRDDIFFGSIIAEMDGKTVSIDSRPSDAIALAVRAHVPIFVGEAIMETACIFPEGDMQQEEPPLGSGRPEKGAGADEGRLSVFEDFLTKLDTDEGDKKARKN